MGDLLGVALTLLLLSANAFFVGAEFSLISARRDRLEALAAEGKPRARTVIEASAHLSLVLAASQLGNTICSILLGKVGEPAIAHLLERPLELTAVPPEFLHPIAFVVAMAIVVMLHILAGEMIPKNIAIAGPERMAMALIPVHLAFMQLARPLIAFYNWAANANLRLFGIEPKEELDSSVSAGQLSVMIGESRSEGLLDAEEHERLTKALASYRRSVGEVMIPSAQVRSLPDAGHGPLLRDVEQNVIDTGFSRFPVRRAHGPGYSGYVHVKDILEALIEQSDGAETSTGAAMRGSMVDPTGDSRRDSTDRPAGVPAAGPTPNATTISPTNIRILPTVRITDSLDDALRELRRHSAHMAAVIAAEPGPSNAPSGAKSAAHPGQAGPQPEDLSRAATPVPAPSGFAAEPEVLGIIALEDLVEEFVGTVRDSTHTRDD